MGAIMQATSWEQLEALTHSHMRSFNHMHVSALVCRLPKLVTPSHLPHAEHGRFSRFLRNVSDLVAVRLPSFDPRAVANVLWAVSKLGFSPSPPLLNKFLFEAYVRMRDFNAQELANLSWALATLAAMGNRPVTVWLREFTAAALPRVQELRPQELAHMAWALSRLCPPIDANSSPPSSVQDADAAPGVSSSAANSTFSEAPGDRTNASEQPSLPALPALVTALIDSAASRLGAFRPGELVMTIMALQRLDPDGTATWLLPAALPHLLAVGSGSRGIALSPQDLGNLWAVLAKAAQSGGKARRAALRVAAAAAAAASTAAAPGSGQGSGGVIADGEPSGKHAQRLKLIPLGPGAMGAPGAGSRPAAASRPSPSLPLSPMMPARQHLYALLELTEASLHTLSMQGLSMVLLAWSALKMQPSPQGADALFTRYSTLMPGHASFNCMAISLWACARLELRPPQALLTQMASCARLQMAIAKPAELVALLWALEQLRFRPAGGFEPALTAALNARRGRLAVALRPHGLHVVLTTYALLGAVPPPAVQARALRAATGAAARVAVAAAAAKAAGGPANPAAHPSVFVRFFACLAGVAMPRCRRLGAREAAIETLQRMRAALWCRSGGAARREELTASLEGAVRGRLGLLSHDALVALAISMMRLRLRPSPELASELHQHTESRLQSLQPWHTVALLAALTWAGVRPNPAWLGTALGSLEPQLDALNSRQLLGVLRSCAVLRYRPSNAWVRTYVLECMARLSTFSARQVGLLLEGLAALGVVMNSKSAVCQELQLVVYRRKAREGEGQEEQAAGGRSVKASLCAVCAGLSGCEVDWEAEGEEGQAGQEMREV